jgi:hypothetical protein
MAGTSPDPVCNYTDTRPSQQNQASCTPDLSYPLVITSFSSSSPISLFVVHNPTIIVEHKVKSSLSNSPCHDHPWVDTEYSIHRVHHTPSTASAEDCLSSVHSHDYVLTAECIISFRRASLHDRPPSASSPWELKGKVTLSHSHICKSTNWWIVSQHPARRPSTGSKYLSNFAWLRPPSSHDHRLQLHLQHRLITASKWISKLARSRPPSSCPNSLHHGFQVHLQTSLIAISECISKFTRSRPPSVCAKAVDYCLQVRLPTRSLAHGLDVYFWVHSIVIFRPDSNCSQAPPAASPDLPCVDW